MKKISLTLCAALLFAAGALTAYAHAQKSADAPPDKHDAKAHAECPLKADGKTPGGKSEAQAGGGGHDAHLAEVNARGEAAMGFSQTETAHHFLLTRDGGVIQVEVKDPADSANRERVRRHLAHIAQTFAAGDFGTPMRVHARTVPGTPTMSRLKSELAYAYEETERGGRVRITARSAEALAAVHEFLRFQIEDHQTGDEK
ncbi:MAG TPA: hypothetical protein VN282_20205 [Pyrinomonadaceae bacterium]|nr:hypothetical protein [Pyrinomonadaceae bacterium]